ncbi:MAG TPA: bifunctional 3,4-dihydroxy-2-butanone-4-phosphate synthase/GTP cyclohydrolase II [Candidatus Peribacteraceae bacterium]|nr:bifunctional 3,4-dihydroxy-2-butanone-4-phosphate synthase/GTP cyclohydrolase II [Candidatus Peribacteraceae bacterium]
MMKHDSIDAALDALKHGRMIIVVDDEDRENEGDLVMAAEFIDEQKMAFMIRHTGGVVCVPLSNEIADQLDLPAMVSRNTSLLGTPYTVSVDATDNTTTGISAADRAQTVKVMGEKNARPDDLRRPGHVFPLRSKDGGVLVRAGHTEATIDLCRMAGLREAGVLSELMHDDGTMMRRVAIDEFAKTHDLPVVTIADLVAYRRQNEHLVTLEAETDLETEFGTWHLKVFKDVVHGAEHVAMVQGEISKDEPVLVRVHSECMTGDVFASLHCDCGEQLHAAMQRIHQEGKGVIIYLRQEGRGIGLANKIRAYELQNKEGLDTVEANVRLGLPVDLREYGIGAQMLCDIGVRKMKLLTNNPKKIAGLQGFGLEVVEQLPIEITPLSERQKKYMQTKKMKMGHLLHL